MQDITFTLPISKVDEEQRVVYGIATTETLDKQNEIVDYQASKKAFSNWGGNIREMHRSDSAVGKAIDIQYDDEKKQVMIGAYISKSPDGENAWTKIKEGILTGFSIGGRVFKTSQETVKSDNGDVNAKRISDYELSETSLVDSPANPQAQFVMVKSAGGHLQQVEEMVEKPQDITPGWMKMYTFSIDQNNQRLQKADNEESMDKRDFSTKERKQMAAEGQAMPDGSFPIANEKDLKNAIQSIGRAKDEAAAKKHIKARARALGLTNVLPDTWKADKPEMTKADEEVVETVTPEVVETPAEEVKDEAEVEAEEVVEEKADQPEMKKGLYEVSSLAMATAQLVCIRDYVEEEAELEQDGSDLPARLNQAVKLLGEILTDMAQEESQEAVKGPEVEAVELADQPADISKAIQDATQAMMTSVTEAFGAKVETLVKPLTERVAALENQPSAADRPKASFIEVEKGSAAVGNPDEARLKELTEIAYTRKNDRSFSIDQRRALVDEMWALQKKVNHTTTADLNPGVVAEFPQAFNTIN